MGKYSFSCKINTPNNNYSVRITKQNKVILVSNYAICDRKRSRFIKNQVSK